MNRGKLVFAQLMQRLPLTTFRCCVTRYRGTFKVRSFSYLDQILCMAFAQLTYRESLRDIEGCLRAHHLTFGIIHQPGPCIPATASAALEGSQSPEARLDLNRATLPRTHSTSSEARFVPNIPLRNGGPKARIAVIPGDGIGREVTPEALKVIRAAASKRNRPVEFVEFDWGADKYLKENVTLPQGAVAMLRDEFDAILFGAMGDPRVPSNQHAADILLGLRFQLDLFVNARPAELFHERLSPLRDCRPIDINLMVLRENTEGLYVGVGGFFKKGTADEIAVQEDVNSRKGVERIIRYAFDFARSHSRGSAGFTPASSGAPRQGSQKPLRVCMSDKSNAMTFAHDLWQRVFKSVREEYADVESRHLYIDTLAMELVRDPKQFDVIVSNNLFGDIISDLAAQLAGGLGLAPSGNIHPGKTSLFEPVHGSAPNIAGKGIANPFGSVLASGMMLDFLGWSEEARLLKESVKSALWDGISTIDLGGKKMTSEIGDWLATFVSKHS